MRQRIYCGVLLPPSVPPPHRLVRMLFELPMIVAGKTRTLVFCLVRLAWMPSTWRLRLARRLLLHIVHKTGP